MDRRRHRRRDRAEHGHDWGDVALLYRKHEIGDVSRSGVSQRGHPLPPRAGTRAGRRSRRRLRHRGGARDREPGTTTVYRDAFFAVVLPRPLFDEARAKAEATSARPAAAAQSHGARGFRGPTRTAARFAARSPIGGTSTRWASGTRRCARSCRSCCRGASAGSGRCSTTGTTRSAIPPDSPTSSRSPSRLAAARARNGDVWMPRMGGVEIALKDMLAADRMSTVSRSARNSSAERRAHRTGRCAVGGAGAGRVQGGAADGDGRIRPPRSSTSRRRSRDDRQRHRRKPRSSRSRPCACATARSSTRFRRS